MSDEEAVAAAALFKALADPARVRIVNMLATAGEGVCVCDLTPHARPVAADGEPSPAQARRGRPAPSRAARARGRFYSLNAGACSSASPRFDEAALTHDRIDGAKEV